MYRICLCLLICFASAAVGARDFKMSSANSGGCPDSAEEKPSPAVGARKAPVPARETRARSGIHGDAIGNNRLQSPRWHSYLPGMFR